MEAYSLYLNALRYVMNADPSVKSSWVDISKYIPFLRRILSCAMCGDILQNPHTPTNGFCLHHVCSTCLDKKKDLKNSCNWCKNPSLFKENKKLRILTLCFKRLCAYISNSRLGNAIEQSKVNEECNDDEFETTQKALQDAAKFEDGYELTAPPADPFIALKVHSKGRKFSQTTFTPASSGEQNNQGNLNSLKQPQRRGRKKIIRNIKSNLSPRLNASAQVKKLKIKARATSLRSNSSIKKSQSSTLNRLQSHRPHRELSGKFSVGQLWRETFLEEKLPEPEVYPDSGIEIEVGNTSDQDNNSAQHSPKGKVVDPDLVKENKSATNVAVSVDRACNQRDTRLHPVTESQRNMRISASETHGKSRFSLVPKKPLRRIQNKHSKTGLYFRNDKKSFSSMSESVQNITANKFHKSRSNNDRSASGKSSISKNKMCRCARFKRPNRLTCLGQKCPCYLNRKPCVDCLCNGCKNPLGHSEAAAPLLMRTKAKENNCCHSHGDSCEISMPRLSPIPRS